MTPPRSRDVAAQPPVAPSTEQAAGPEPTAPPRSRSGRRAKAAATSGAKETAAGQPAEVANPAAGSPVAAKKGSHAKASGGALATDVTEPAPARRTRGAAASKAPSQGASKEPGAGGAEALSPLLDPQTLRTLQGPYATGPADGLRDPEWLRQARWRRRQLGESMRAFDIDTARQRLPAAEDYVISRKIDGEFTCLLYSEGVCLTLNPGGTVRVGAPFHGEVSAKLAAAGVKEAFLGGELYVRRTDGQRPRVHDVTRVARKPADDAEVGSLCYAVFDIYSLDGEDWSARHGEALEKASELFSGGERVHVVERSTGDRETVFAHYRQWVEKEGAEGVVVRSTSAGMFKIKPRHSLDLAVVGFSEGIDDRAGLLHSLLLAVPIDADSFQLVGRVGGGFSDELRASLLQQLAERAVESDYVEVNSDQVGYRMIEPGLVAELSCLDVVSRTSQGSSIDRMVLDWHASQRRWEGVRRLPLCSLISPQFVRLRDDKQATPEHVRLSQLSDIADIPEMERGVAEIRLPVSTVLERAVAVKVLRGATMVRKLLLWKTNKEQLSRDHHAYVLHLTDYSPNRESPLNHEIRVSSSEAQIRRMFAAWKEQVFVGGWKEVGPAGA
ncbi:MAG: hypothetical protein ACK575_05875 [Cyanobacteriota bacterium]